MFKKETYIARREQLRKDVGHGIIVLPGNHEAPCNYTDNTYWFRQDSTFLYFFGLQRETSWASSTATMARTTSSPTTTTSTTSSGRARCPASKSWPPAWV